jgi:uncharacterized protein (DUF1330 family)
MPAYVIVDIEITDPVQYEHYKTLAPATVAAFGGRYVARGGATISLEGGWRSGRLVILEFDSLDRARAWHVSPGYRAARTLRQSATRSGMIAVEGV